MLVSVTAFGKCEGSRIVAQRLQYYRHAFPHLTFLWLCGEQDQAQLKVLPAMLGHGANDEDYAHPPYVRQTLLEAEFHRIATLLAHDMPSATLFHAGRLSAFSTPKVCVITLNSREFVADPLAASRFFLDRRHIPKALIIAPDAALRFTLDHEVFHCLDAYLNGPLFPITHSPARQQYAQLQAEMRADYYAALRHRLQTGDKRFVRIFAKLRTFGLLDWDFEHYTRPALEAVLRQPLNTITDRSPRALAARARRAVRRLLPTFGSFLRWRAAAYRAAVAHGSWAAAEARSAASIAVKRANPQALLAINRHLTQVVQLLQPNQRTPHSTELPQSSELTLKSGP